MNGKCRARVGTVFLSAVMAVPLSGFAQSYYWTGTDTVEGGAGAWGTSNITAEMAWKRNNAGALVCWPAAASTAVFAGALQTGNTVSLVDDVNVSAMLFTAGSASAGAYTIRQGTAGAGILLTSGATITDYNRDALISVPLISSGGLTLTQSISSTYGKLQLENAAGSNRFGGDVSIVGTSTAFGTLLRVRDDEQLNSSVDPSGKATVVLTGGAQFGSSSDLGTALISSPVRIGNALSGQPYGGVLVGSYQAANVNTTYSGGLLGSGGTGSLLIRPVDDNHTITLAGAGSFDRPIVLYGVHDATTAARKTTLIVTASNALGAGHDNAESAWTDIGTDNTLRFARAGTWTYAEHELLALRAADGASGSAVQVPIGDLTFNGGLALVRGTPLSSTMAGGGVDSTRYPSVNVAAGASIDVASPIRDSGTGTAIGWRKTGAGTLVVPHASTFAQQQFTYGGELRVPFVDRTSQPLGANGDAKTFLDDTASLWVKYDKSGIANGSTIGFFNDLPEHTPLVRENNESMLIAGVGVMDTSDAEGRRKGSIEIGPGLDITQTGRNGSGALRVWHLTDGEYVRPGNVANIDAFVRVAPTSTYRIDAIQTVWQTNGGDADGYLGGGAPSKVGNVNVVFGGGGTIHLNGVASNDAAAYRLNMLAADATTLITSGKAGTASIAERGFGFIGDHAAFGAAGTYVPPILRVEAGDASAFASAIVLRKVDSGDRLSAVIDTPSLSTAESAKVDGDVANATPGFVTLTKQGEGRLDVKKVLLSDGRAAGGDLTLLGGAIRVHGTDGPSRVTSLSIRDARFEMTPGTGIIIDGSTTTCADIEHAVSGGWDNGAWDGQGIALAEANDQWRIGYAVAGAVRRSNDRSFMSRAGATSSVDSIEPTDLLVRAVYAGDTDLDGGVAIDDLYNLALNYGLKEKTWSEGDLTYSADGAVAFDDLLALAKTYGLGRGPDESGISGSLAVFLELRAGAPWILDDVLSHPAGRAVYAAYLDGGSGLGEGYVTQLQNYPLMNNLIPEPSSLAALLLLGAMGRRRR